MKTPHIKIDIEGDISAKIISVLKKVYGKKMKLITDDDELTDVFTTDWLKDIDKKMFPGKNMKIYRGIHKMTRQEPGRCFTSEYFTYGKRKKSDKQAKRETII